MMGNTNDDRETKRNGYAVMIVTACAAALFAAVVIGSIFWFGILPRSADDVETADLTTALPGQDSKLGDYTSPQAAEKELIGYINRSEELLSEAYSDIEALNDSETNEELVESFGKQADILENLLSELSSLQRQAEAVSGADASLANAGTEYFNMVYDSQKACYEVYSFFADYFDLYGNILVNRPEVGDYDSGDYYNAIYEWYESAKEGCASIDSCPSCLENEWQQYIEIVDLNQSISQKLYLAEKYGDYLRYRSALNMSDRYITVEELQYKELMDCLAGEIDHFERQQILSAELAEEIYAYAEMEQEERSGYEFEHIYTGEISLSYDAVDTIYPSLYHSYDAFLVVRTGCVSGSRNIVVEAEIPGFTQNYKESFTLDSAYKEIYIKPPALTGDLNLSLSKDAQIKVTVSEKDGTLIEAKSFPITIKSKYDFEWYSDEYGVSTQDNILCFMTPEASAISRLKRQAIEEITSMTNGRMESFVGYQNTGWNNHYVGTYLQTAGIMRALYEMEVRYNMDPFSISGSNQHILFPEDVVEQKSGLCIETSLTVASALQSAGMHVFLIFPPGHAQVAVEVWNGRGENKSGTGKYFLIETTALSDSSNNQQIFVENANALIENINLGTGPIVYYKQEDWRNYITDDTYIIDCDDLGVLGLTPFAN